MALISINYTFISKECLESIHESYATQLQSIGLWHWSIFILMHIEDEKRLVNYLKLTVVFKNKLNYRKKKTMKKILFSF
jgi:hypothetical protein